jgi:hypothetical protein
MRQRAALALIALCWACDPGIAAEAGISGADYPTFLPPYYAPVLTVDGTPLHLTGHDEKENESHYDYSSADQALNLAIENFRCDSARCATVYDNAARYVDTTVTKNGGSFRVTTPTEFRADWHTGLGDIYLFVFRLPSSVVFWTYGARLERKLDIDGAFERVKALVNRQRYEEALHAGNVDMGHWAPQIRDLARERLEEKKTDEALAIFRNLIATSPSDYQSQMDLAEATSDVAAKRESARVVLENAEDPTLIEKAAHILGVSGPDAAALPVLDKNEHGLELVLVPLPPCDLRLLQEAAPIYEKITGVPVKVARLAETWRFGAPDRIPDQRTVQQAILQQEGPTVDFTGWSQEHYAAELMKTVGAKSALAAFSTKTFIDNLNEKPGQYRIDPYLDHFMDIIAPYRSSDKRTMYVGVTEANIYSGDSNYVFSTYEAKDSGGASILSYSMMLAKTTGEAYQSRKRLVERIAKELVPASLKTLDIPRPADPTDPYSYSSGLDRLAQKGLVLSPPVKEALDKFR